MALGFNPPPGADQDAADAGAYANLPTAMQAGGQYSVVAPPPPLPAVVAAAQTAPDPNASAPAIGAAPAADPASGAPSTMAAGSPAPTAPSQTPIGPAAAFLHRVLGIPDGGVSGQSPTTAAPAGQALSPQGVPTSGSSAAVTPVFPQIARKPLSPLEKIGDVLLGGWPSHFANIDYQRSLVPLQMQQFQNARAVVEEMGKSGALSGASLDAARSDPLGTLGAIQAAQAERMKPAVLKSGEYRDAGLGGGSGVFNPVFDPQSGRFVQPTPGGGLAASGSAGGDYTMAANGADYSQRTGEVRGVVPSYANNGGVVYASNVPGAPVAQNIPQPQKYGIGGGRESVQFMAPPISGATDAGVFAPGTGTASPPAGAGGPSAATTGSASLAAMSPGGKLDPQAFYRNFVLKHEGGLNPHDMNGAPTNYGFNQTANPDIDVKALTPDAAAARFASKYYPQSGAANLPPALAAIHADTSFINPSAAQRFLRRSGGDPASYMQQREQWMANQVRDNPAARPYAKAWATRNADLSQLAGIGAGGAPQTPSASVSGGYTGPPTGADSSKPLIQDGGYDPSTDSMVQVNTATGEKTYKPVADGFDRASATRTKIESNPIYQNASTAVQQSNALNRMLNGAKDNNGIVDMDALEKSIKAASGGNGGVRLGNVQMFLEHQGLWDSLKNHVSKNLANAPLTPQVLSHLQDMTNANTQAALGSAQSLIDDNDRFLRTHNGNRQGLDMRLPQLDRPQTPEWMHQGPGAVPRAASASNATPTQLSGANAAAQYQSLPSGAHFIDPNGVARVKR